MREQYQSEKIIFLGDRTFEGGNDYALAHELSLMENTQVVQVENPTEVIKFLMNEDKQ